MAQIVIPKVEIKKDSAHPNGVDRFTTFLIKFPKCLLAELNTHRQLVRNVGSSRAVPVKVMREKVKKDPFVPIFSRNQKGMSGADTLTDEEVNDATAIWLDGLEQSIEYSIALEQLEIHKEATNRLLEPYMYVDVLLSGTEWENFFKLRRSPAAQKSFKVIADAMYEVYEASTPQQLNYGDWHLPFDEWFPEESTLGDKLDISSARCARLSYLSHGKEHKPKDDFRLAESLLVDGHMTPFEHIAKVVDNQEDIICENPYKNGEVSIRNYLPENLQPYLFLRDKYDDKFSWSRQYAGFYTYRHHIEDGVAIS